jgi:hypothetical protein
LIYLYRCTGENCKCLRETDVTTLMEPCCRCGEPMVLEETFGFREDPAAPSAPTEKPHLRIARKPKTRRKRVS